MLTLRCSSRLAGLLQSHHCRRLASNSHLYASNAASDEQRSTKRFDGKIQDQPDADQGVKFTQKEFRQSAGYGIPSKGDDYFDKNLKLKRPLSPHLTVYKMYQLPMLLSISHRICGVILSVGLSLTSVGILMASHDFVHYVDAIRTMHLNEYFITTIKFGAAWMLTYHYLNGIRHLFWDAGLGFKIPDLYRSGYTVVALSILTAFYLASLK